MDREGARLVHSRQQPDEAPQWGRRGSLPGECGAAPALDARGRRGVPRRRMPDADRIARAALLLLESHDVEGFLQTLPAPKESALQGGRAGVERTWALASPLRVSLTPEGLSKKLVKLFKGEIQTGDDDFDAKVFIETDTPELAAAWLDIPSLRSAILPLVESGGGVEVNGDTVALRAYSDGDAMRVLDDRAAAVILAHVEAVARPPEG